MLTRNTLKKIKHSFGRFASLIAIILIGVGFYAGIRQSIPAIRDVQNTFTKNTNLMDIHLMSTLGFTDEDISELEKLKMTDKVTAGYSTYVYDDEDVLRVLSIDNNINRTKLKDGTRPVTDDECLADASFYKVGDVITVREPEGEEAEVSESEVSEAEASEAEASESEADTATDGDAHEEESDGILKIHKYKVVGTVVSPLYMGEDYGSVSIGNGVLKSYILVDKDCFNMDAYSDIYLTIKKTEKDVPYSKSYDKKVDEIKKQLDKLKVTRQEAREKEVFERARQAAYTEVEKRREEIRKEVRKELEDRITKEVEDERERQKAKLKEKAAKLGIGLDLLIETLSEPVKA